jgi:hypothetical protein
MTCCHYARGLEAGRLFAAAQADEMALHLEEQIRVGLGDESEVFLSLAYRGLARVLRELPLPYHPCLPPLPP